MPKKMNKKEVSFGTRLAELRKTAGYTQQELANEIGVTRRTITYYEGETKNPPAAILPDLAKSLGVTIDELFGLKTVKKTNNVNKSRLQRRVQQIEKMKSKEKRQILQLIDAFIEREQLKKKVSVL